MAVVPFALLSTGLGVTAWLAPEILVKRFQWQSELGVSIVAVLRAVGPALLAMGAAAFISCWRWAAEHARSAGLLFGLLAVAGYLSLTTCLSTWTVDDAAITFAYSKNLATGHGIVIHPGHAPEEGYSNTSWMLLLAAAHFLGADIAVTAKYACIGFGVLAVALSLFVGYRIAQERARFELLALGAVTCLGAPFIIWSCSGLEHSLQAAMLATVVAAPLWPRYERLLLAIALSTLVLTRPEAPLAVGLVAAVLAFRDRSPGAVRRAVRRYWPVVALPVAAWALLMVFRLAYFGDPLSNPYYAKAQGASWLRVVNFVGGAWSYVFSWLADARTWLLLPVVMAVPLGGRPLPQQLAAVLCVAHLLFVLFVGGDWMGCYRFIAPILPVFAVLVVASASELGRQRSALFAASASLLGVWLLGLGTLAQLISFHAHPTTPAAVVARIGNTFVELARRLGIDQPSLAHHDAGGTSYESGLDLIDLGGLGDRAVAKHMADREFMRQYLFEEKRPTFIFGSSRVFAAGATEFFRMPEFNAYVRLRFPGQPYMEADLCQWDPLESTCRHASLSIL